MAEVILRASSHSPIHQASTTARTPPTPAPAATASSERRSSSREISSREISSREISHLVRSHIVIPPPPSPSPTHRARCSRPGVQLCRRRWPTCLNSSVIAVLDSCLALVRALFGEMCYHPTMAPGWRAERAKGKTQGILPFLFFRCVYGFTLIFILSRRIYFRVFLFLRLKFIEKPTVPNSLSF